MAKNKSSARIVTPVGRLSFPYLFTPEVNKLNPGAPAKYTSLIVFDSDADLHKIEAIMAEVIAAQWGDAGLPAGANNPLRDASEKAGMGEPFTSGSKFIKVQSQFAPGLVDINRQPILDPKEIYRGVYARVHIHAYAYDNVQKGVGFGLDNVQKVEDGPVEGSTADAGSAFPDDLDDLL